MVDSSELKEILSIHHKYASSNLADAISEFFEYRNFKKGDILVTNKGLCHSCFFLCSGFTRAYLDSENGNQTLWFGERGDFVTSFQTLFNQQQGNEIVVALTDCKTMVIDLGRFRKLITELPELASVYIEIVEAGYQYWEKRFLIHSQQDAYNRYVEWMSRTKHMTEHIPMGVLAQYLNIDQATLSRIRAKKEE